MPVVQFLFVWGAGFTLGPFFLPSNYRGKGVKRKINRNKWWEYLKLAVPSQCQHRQTNTQHHEQPSHPHPRYINTGRNPKGKTRSPRTPCEAGRGRIRPLTANAIRSRVLRLLSHTSRILLITIIRGAPAPHNTQHNDTRTKGCGLPQLNNALHHRRGLRLHPGQCRGIWWSPNNRTRATMGHNRLRKGATASQR